ncbi:hypothetical protein YPPY52_4417, partial [Yersinia pestis PY-52]
MVVQEQRV